MFVSVIPEPEIAEISFLKCSPKALTFLPRILSPVSTRRSPMPLFSTSFVIVLFFNYFTY